MKLDHRDIKDLDDFDLVQEYQKMLAAEQKRLKAAEHPKFEKMAFPPINPAFLDLKQAIKTELDNRKLEIEQ